MGVGAFVGLLVGEPVGGLVGADVGLFVGELVGELVGAAVVGLAVGADVSVGDVGPAEDEGTLEGESDELNEGLSVGCNQRRWRHKLLVGQIQIIVE